MDDHFSSQIVLVNIKPLMCLIELWSRPCELLMLFYCFQSSKISRCLIDIENSIFLVSAEPQDVIFCSHLQHSSLES